jgi:hypothetical protein
MVHGIDKVLGTIDMSSSVIIDPSYAAACAAMNLAIAGAPLPRETNEATLHQKEEAVKSAFMDERVDRIISTEHTMALADGRELHGDPCSTDCMKLFVRERMNYPRMQRLHSLLCADKEPESIFIVENAAGGVPHVSMVLASMGYHVLIKDPDPYPIRAQMRLSKTHLPKDWLGRIIYFNDDDTVATRTPSHVVYWVNPAYTMFMHLQKKEDRTPERLALLADYMGRDVMLGGYLVIQTDDNLYNALPFDESRWEVIYDKTLNDRGPLRGVVLPTFFHGIPNQFRIFRRFA